MVLIHKLRERLKNVFYSTIRPVAARSTLRRLPVRRREHDARCFLYYLLSSLHIISFLTWQYLISLISLIHFFSFQRMP